MNNRIFELAKQADEYTEQTVHYYQGQFDGLTWEGKIKQTRDTKFAELIVKECTKVLEIQGANTGHEQYYYGASLIEEHFGVE